MTDIRILVKILLMTNGEHDEVDSRQKNIRNKEFN